MGALPSSILHLPMRGSGPPPNTWAHRSSKPNGISIVSAILHSSLQSLAQWASPSLSKLPVPVGDLDPHLIHGSLVQPKSSIQAASPLLTVHSIIILHDCWFMVFLSSSISWFTVYLVWYCNLVFLIFVDPYWTDTLFMHPVLHGSKICFQARYCTRRPNLVLVFYVYFVL